MARISLALLFSLAAIAPASAQDGPTVSMSGTARQAFEPNLVRVRWRVHASGKSAGSALKKLDASRKTLEKRFAGLSAPKPTVAMSDFQELGPKEDAAGFQARIMNAAMGGNQQEDDPSKKLIRLGFTVTVEWPLSGKTVAERHREVDEIRQQLGDIKVLDSEAAKNSDDSEEEDDSAADKPGDGDESAADATVRVEAGPTFYFVRLLSDAEAAGVAKAAFEAAKSKAARMATASGMSLGDLVSLSDSQNLERVMSEQMTQSMNIAVSMFGQTRASFDEDSARPPTEVTSDRLKPAYYQANVTAVFKLKK